MSLDPHTALALLDWQIELGADEALLDQPVNRFELEAKPARPAASVAPPPAARGREQSAPAAPVKRPVTEPQIDVVAEARAAAAAAQDLDGLRAALDRFPHCELKLGAQSLVFGDGTPGARVMIIGEAPGRDEDREGRPFVGRAGQLLDRMFDAIGLARTGTGDGALYISNILPWRPPQNRDPSAEEIAMMRPFMERHVALAKPDILVLMGNISCHAMLDRQGMLSRQEMPGRRGIARLRGDWQEACDRPALPMFHPDYLLRNPGMKREAWADLLALKAKLS